MKASSVRFPAAFALLLLGCSSGDNREGSTAIPPPPGPGPAPDPGLPTVVTYADSLTQHGITWTFDKPYATGQYANGDFWVAVDPGTQTVRVITISPPFTGSMNGWEVNPADKVKQGFDSRIYDFDPARVPALPYDALPGKSIVKAISLNPVPAGIQTFLKTAAVLTVVPEIPLSASTLFRPPYFGPDKPTYRTTDLQTQLLPSIAPSANAPTLDIVRQWFERVWLDHKEGWTGRAMHPADNMPDYGAGMAVETGEAALRLMLDDPVGEKVPALIRFVQYGIDLYAMRLGGVVWGGAGGGHGVGRKIVLAFAGLLFNHAGMIAATANPPSKDNTFSEDGSCLYAIPARTTLWGQPGTAAQYWNNQLTGSGGRSVRDPYGYIDGGEIPGGVYQFCCTSQTWKGAALAVHLMPQLRPIWNYEPFLDYVDRWVDFGAWTQPDPYAPLGSGAFDTDPSNGIGRYPALHGTNKNSGYWGSVFANSMWTQYRPAGTARMPHIQPYGGTFAGSVVVNLQTPHTPGAILRYTTDGSDPTAGSPLFTGPFPITTSLTIRARAFAPGLNDSAVNRASFTIN